MLDLRSGSRRFDVVRARPSPALADLVEHYWTVSWDLRGRQPHTQHTLPHPSVHLVAERDRSGVMGVLTGRFSRRLEGEGRAFGIRFRPAGFHPFLGAPVAGLTDRRVAVAEVFGPAGDRLVAELLAADGEARLVAVAEAFLLARPPAPDPNVPLVNRVVDQVVADRDVTRVADVTDRTGMGTRRLQRLFATYVGVPPKWVIRRARLHEAVERLDRDDEVDLAFLAWELGYFDQAHFTRDFRSAVGRPPTAYARTSPSWPSGRRRVEAWRPAEQLPGPEEDLVEHLLGQASGGGVLLPQLNVSTPKRASREWPSAPEQLFWVTERQPDA